MALKNSLAPSSASLSSLLQSMRGPRIRQPLVERHEPALPKGGRKEIAKSKESKESSAAWGEVETPRLGQPVARRSQQGGAHTGSGHAGHRDSLPELSGHGREGPRVGPALFVSPAFAFQPREEVNSLLTQSLAVRFMSGRPVKMPRSPLQDLTSRVLKAAADSRLAVTHSSPLKFPLAIYA